ncbi:putative 5'-AMP-activated protein kinase subunit beta-1 family protein [Besnoitia besnoiti]|uniref:Putative 5'-AMP-activated protein kinase subunit beta-1 family protein n=1 Tax=Besnoitia besnoiti TaxID=94643 RepID=A0A2A9MJJ1_BESBE|nr:putative 5'-AMP-activated protein kinase subunit beta-1 family protein [Besnoitia besnoiti]PFH35570.1 putative 5'-AMP-activated protein kinase subunit beta-1 family protein [Besnoitia besnoiti]
MGSQTSSSRHQSLGDMDQPGFPGLGAMGSAEGSAELLLPHGLMAHGGASAGGQSVSFSAAAAAAAAVVDASATSSAYVRRNDEGKRTEDGDGKAGDGAVEKAEEAEGANDELIPCVFTWTHGGHSVYLAGSFNGWSVEKKLRLNRSGHEFSYIQNLPRGVHYYKFIVDDQWKYAPDQLTKTDEDGNINNVLDISSFTHINFKIIRENAQARRAVYRQCVPEPSEYSSDAPAIPILLGRSTYLAMDPPPRPGGGIPVHCLANHLYHDAFAPAVFGPHTSCIATTHRWQIGNARATSGQRYTTYIYVTVNPLYPFPPPPEDAEAEGETNATEAAALAAAAWPNPVANMVVCRGKKRRARRSVVSSAVARERFDAASATPAAESAHGAESRC